MIKSAEEFIREKSFPNGITEDKWEEHKRNHSGINWVDFAIKAMEEHTKQELIAFKKWYDTLKPTDKISVWDADGNQKGLFNLSDEQIVENWNRHQEPKNTKFANPDAVIDVITN